MAFYGCQADGSGHFENASPLKDKELQSSKRKKGGKEVGYIKTLLTDGDGSSQILCKSLGVARRSLAIRVDL